MTDIAQFELSREFVDRLNQAVSAKDVDFIKSALGGVNPADITETLEEFTTDDSKYVLDQLVTEVGAEVIANLDEDTRKRFLRVFTADEIAKYVIVLDSDDAVDILNELPVKIREEIISLLPEDEKTSHILDLMKYEEDVAGGLMAKELIKARNSWTIEQTIEEIRHQGENVSKIYSVYVVDDQNHLLGKVSLRKMLLAKDGTLIKDIYNDEIIAVKTYEDEEEVVAIMKKYDLEVIPVINMHGKLVGRITIDDVVDVMSDQADEERNLMSGISEDVEQDDTIWRQSRARIPWLIIGIAGSFLGAQIIGLFEGEIVVVPMLAAFIPLITSTGGNVAIQSSSLVVQSLANKPAFQESPFTRIIKVVLVALLNGILLAVIAFGISYFLRQNITVSLVVGTALACVVLLASLSGTVTPIIMDKFNINPAAASGPFITTANDILGLVVYFTVAHLLLNF